MVNDTTFQQLCRNRSGALFATKPIRFINRDFFGEAVKAELMTCLADLNEFLQDPESGIVTPISARWWVGSFFISSEMLELPEIRCMDRGYPGYDQLYCDGLWGRRLTTAFQNTCKNPSLVEVTIMVRQDSRYGNGPRSVISDPSDFARVAQTFFMNNFNEIVPIR